MIRTTCESVPGVRVAQRVVGKDMAALGKGSELVSGCVSEEGDLGGKIHSEVVTWNATNLQTEKKP